MNVWLILLFSFRFMFFWPLYKRRKSIVIISDETITQTTACDIESKCDSSIIETQF
jgi:hypothetical protein